MKRIKITVMLLILLCITLPAHIYAQSAQEGDKFEKCSKAGVGTGVTFLPTATTPATLNISNIDPNYTYYGVDTGVFRKTSATDWTNLFDIHREPTNNTIIKIASYGTMTSYNYDDIYMLGCRILYQTTEGDIIEGPWQMDEGNCFKVYVLQAVISDFTDRVTGANMWIDQEKAALPTQAERDAYENRIITKGLNNYFPNSEVVCKFVLDPQGADVQKYNINFNANSDLTIEKIGNLAIDYIKIVRIDHGAVKGEDNGNPGPPPPGGSDNPLCGNTNQKLIDFEINNSGTDVLTVYVKYRFKNFKINDDIVGNMPSQFKSKVSVEAVTAGGTKTLAPMENIIRLRKAIPQYM